MSLRRILERRGALAGREAPADPAPGPGDTLAPDLRPAAPAMAAGRRPVPLVDAGDPRATLWWHFDTWARLKEAEWTQDEVNALYNAIIGFWEGHPTEAEGWWREWRAANPGARLW